MYTIPWDRGGVLSLFVMFFYLQVAVLDCGEDKFTPNSHEDGEEHSSFVVKQMGLLKKEKEKTNKKVGSKILN